MATINCLEVCTRSSFHLIFVSPHVLLLLYSLINMFRSSIPRISSCCAVITSAPPSTGYTDSTMNVSSTMVLKGQ